MEDSEPPTISFTERSKQLSLDSTVRCSRCNKLILMHSTRCEHCGIHFSGEAWQFSPSSEINVRQVSRASKWLITILVFVIVSMLLLY